jgi:hypothetical protein
MLPAGARRLVAAGLLRAAVGAAQALRRARQEWPSRVAARQVVRRRGEKQERKRERRT